MEEIGKTLVKFWELCGRSPMARAAAVAVPGAGNSLAVLMSAKDHDELLAKFSEIATEQQEQAVLPSDPSCTWGGTRLKSCALILINTAGRAGVLDIA